MLRSRSEVVLVEAVGGEALLAAEFVWLAAGRRHLATVLEAAESGAEVG